MPILKVKISAWYEDHDDELIDLIVGTLAYDGKDIKVFTKNKKIEENIKKAIASYPEKLKKRFPLKKGNLDYSDLGSTDLYLTFHARFNSKSIINNKEIFFANAPELSLFRENENSEVRVVCNWAKNDPYAGVFGYLRQKALFVFDLLLLEEKEEWARLNKKYPMRRKRHDFLIDNGWGNKLHWGEYLYDPVIYSYNLEYVYSPSLREETINRDSFVYEFVWAEILGNISDNYKVVSDKKDFFKRVLLRLWKDDYVWIVLDKR
ncbi:MAG: hypothetical protein PHH27_02935 [Candidatus Colwellbacteria bacterium]|nr:hypothetical protein [Candidatus Colwellbacteria bacterium]MDD4819107.1 hypothetical protein [Candidatus Colwellbacteria bacterium]